MPREIAIKVHAQLIILAIMPLYISASISTCADIDAPPPYRAAASDRCTAFQSARFLLIQNYASYRQRRYRRIEGRIYSVCRF